MWLKYKGEYINLDRVTEIHTVDFVSTVIDSSFYVIFSFGDTDEAVLAFKTAEGRQAFLYKLDNKLTLLSLFSPQIVEEMSDEERRVYDQSMSE